MPMCTALLGLRIKAAAASAISMVPENPGRFERRQYFSKWIKPNTLFVIVFSTAHNVIDENTL